MWRGTRGEGEVSDGAEAMGNWLAVEEAQIWGVRGKRARDFNQQWPGSESTSDRDAGGDKDRILGAPEGAGGRYFASATRVW